jgi:hypothetical protein
MWQSLAASADPIELVDAGGGDGPPNRGLTVYR